ncbi:hypothetical protein Fot_56158 [Forsythia ovata]|uniref:Uncharacterized protein n=1 Tax=Forsythia ovata TaxID=205694 RepID=A0ABD1P188_9LAMI
MTVQNSSEQQSPTEILKGKTILKILLEDTQWGKNASLLQEIVKKKRTMIFAASKFRKSRKYPAGGYGFQEFHVSNDFCSLQVQSITKKESFGAEPNSNMMDSDLNKI